MHVGSCGRKSRVSENGRPRSNDNAAGADVNHGMRLFRLLPLPNLVRDGLELEGLSPLNQSTRLSCEERLKKKAYPFLIFHICYTKSVVHQGEKFEFHPLQKRRLRNTPKTGTLRTLISSIFIPVSSAKMRFVNRWSSRNLIARIRATTHTLNSEPRWTCFGDGSLDSRSRYLSETTTIDTGVQVRLSSVRQNLLNRDEFEAIAFWRSIKGEAGEGTRPGEFKSGLLFITFPRDNTVEGGEG